MLRDAPQVPRKPSRRATLSPDEQKALLVEQQKVLDAEIEAKRRKKKHLQDQIATLDFIERHTREVALGKLAYDAGLAGADDDVLKVEFLLLANRLCGVQHVLQLVDDAGRCLVAPVGLKVEGSEAHA